MGVLESEVRDMSTALQNPKQPGRRRREAPQYVMVSHTKAWCIFLMNPSGFPEGLSSTILLTYVCNRDNIFRIRSSRVNLRFRPYRPLWLRLFFSLEITSVQW